MSTSSFAIKEYKASVLYRRIVRRLVKNLGGNRRGNSHLVVGILSGFETCIALTTCSQEFIADGWSGHIKH
jgi:hypothetical protein